MKGKTKPAPEPTMFTYEILGTTEETETVPNECPHCGHDLTQPNGAVEFRYIATMQYCRVTPDGLDEYGDYEDFAEEGRVVGMGCGSCEKVIVGVDS